MRRWRALERRAVGGVSAHWDRFVFEASGGPSAKGEIRGGWLLTGAAHVFYSTHVRNRRSEVPFAISLIAVVSLSTVMLVYQYVSGSLAHDDAETVT